MKTILTLTLLFFGTVLFAQKNFYMITNGSFVSAQEYGWNYNNNIQKQELFKENQIEQISITKYSKGKSNHRIEYFNADGKMIKSEFIYGKKKNVTEYKHDEKGNLILLKFTDSNGKERKTTYKYDTKGNIIELEIIDKKGNYYGRFKKYNADGKITSILIFEKDKERPKKELYYTYYPDGSKKQTLYKVKGKVKYTWNFECSEEGKLVTNEKNESKICILKEEDKDGNIVTWNREFHKGKLIKTKTVKTKENKWILTEFYNEDDELYAITQRKKEGGLIRKNRNKKGDMVKTYETFTNKNGKITKQIYYNKKWGYTKIMNYENDLLISEIRIHKNHTYVNEYTYLTRS